MRSSGFLLSAALLIGSAVDVLGGGAPVSVVVTLRGKKYDVKGATNVADVQKSVEEQAGLAKEQQACRANEKSRRRAAVPEAPALRPRDKPLLTDARRTMNPLFRRATNKRSALRVGGSFPGRSAARLGYGSRGGAPVAAAPPTLASSTAAATTPTTAATIKALTTSTSTLTPTTTTTTTAATPTTASTAATSTTTLTPPSTTTTTPTTLTPPSTTTTTTTTTPTPTAPTTTAFGRFRFSSFRAAPRFSGTNYLELVWKNIRSINSERVSGSPLASTNVSYPRHFLGFVSALALINTIRGRPPEGREAVDPAGKRRHRTALVLSTVAVVMATAAVAIAIYTMVMLLAILSSFGQVFGGLGSLFGS